MNGLSGSGIEQVLVMTVVIVLLMAARPRRDR
jgi:hypothetical protein